MTLASHVRGPEFKPRCEYYHFFCFHPKKTEKTQSFWWCTTIIDPTQHDAGMMVMVSSWELVEEALVMIQACIKCSPHIIQTWKGVELSHTSFFKTGWECVTWPDLESYGSRSRDTLTAQPKLLAQKRNMHQTFCNTTTQSLDIHLLNNSFLMMAQKHLAAPGSSARPGPRSWSASKPDAWSMDVAQTIQLISFVTV